MSQSAAIAFHASAEATARDRGFALGRSHASAVANTVRVYRRMLAEQAALSTAEVREFGRQLAQALIDRGDEDLVDEVDGIAAGAEQDADEVMALNARTELLVGRQPSECSLIGLEPRASQEGRCIVAQNWDWHPDLAASTLLWRVESESGAFVTLTEAGILAKVGVNDRRVGCGLNFLASSSDQRTPKPDAIHLLLRKILEHADGLSSAVATVEHAQPSASAAITVAAGHPGVEGLAALELTPTTVYRQEADGAGVVVHTNHFLSALGDETDTTAIGDDLAGSRRRLEQLSAIGHQRPSEAQLRAVLASHRGEPFGVCAHQDVDRPWAERYVTLASVVIDASNARIWVAPGQPCRARQGEEVTLDTSPGATIRSGLTSRD